MNLTDLRDELSQRANTVESPDLLPGVRRRIRTTKRRRVAGSVTALAAIVALGIAVAPSLTSSAPEPADSIPPDYTRDSVTLKGVIGTDRLDRAWIGSVGETRGSFGWTPTTKNIVVYAYCAAPGETRYTVRIGGRNAVTGPCNVAHDTPGDTGLIRPDAALWLDVPLHQATTVNVQLTDNDGRVIESSTAQLGVGIYTAGRRDPVPGATGATPTPGPGDREENGLLFRAKIGGDTLAAAESGEPGVSKVTDSYVATGRPIMVSAFCTANDASSGFPYHLRVVIGGVEKISGCVALSTDVGSTGGAGLSDIATPGQRMTVTATLTDESGREVKVPGARIAFAVYEKGPQRVYDNTAVDERREYSGTTYQLAEIEAVDATSTRQVSLRTPADTPFLITYGSSSLGAPVEGTLDRPTSQSMLNTSHGEGGLKSWGLATDGNWAGPSTTITLKITRGTPTKGKLILAIYTPAK
ncbi:hypothetical protein BWI15_36870 [Kribbella sp. ALI-6-A]|uniref:hypothetical protein n=1 Tax=Kribbella sp. ALI-6-A TaxID=1933817 RepID=UPI00097C0AF7|nr:hypothetical protein [Kribbella sp. ALI-6-A]ONI68564.1 hypothetical protein BWI15_36870 [Kribbella sp. ALI-6-A]